MDIKGLSKKESNFTDGLTCTSWGLALLYGLYSLVLKIELWELYCHYSPFTKEKKRKMWVSKMCGGLPKETKPVSGIAKILT